MRGILLVILFLLPLQAGAQEELRTYLQGVFDRIPETSKVTVEAENGVVVLRGEVASAEVAERAVELAKARDEVVWVRDETEVPLKISSRLQPAVDKLGELGTRSLAYLPLIGVALVVFFLFRLIGLWLVKAKWWRRRMKLSSLGEVLLERVIRLGAALFGILLALEILDATAVVGAILGVAGVLGVALGFAFRNIIENYLAGVLLSARNPFEIGDFIEVGGKSGKVARLNSRDTVLITGDGNHLRLPNSMLINTDLLNFTRNPQRRFEFFIEVDPDCDVRHALALIDEELAGLGEVLEDPAPSTMVHQLADNLLQLRVFAWLDQRESDLLKLAGEAIVRVKERFAREGIVVPEPTYRIIQQQEKPLEERVVEPHGEQPDLSPDTSVDKTVLKESQEGKGTNLL